MMDGEEKAKIPTAYQTFAHHVNHLRLAFINRLAKKAGLNFNVHGNVERIPRDNGERFFSLYLMQERERNEKYTPDLVTQRCMCIRCGGRKNINNPYANSITINAVAERTERDNDDEKQPAAAPPIKKRRRMVPQIKSKTKKKKQLNLKQPPPYSITPPPKVASLSRTITSTSSASASTVKTLPPPTAASSSLNPSLFDPSMMLSPAMNQLFISTPYPLLPFAAQLVPPLITPRPEAVCRCTCIPSFDRHMGYCCDVNYRYNTDKTRKYGRPPHCKICNSFKRKGKKKKSK